MDRTELRLLWQRCGCWCCRLAGADDELILLLLLFVGARVAPTVVGGETTRGQSPTSRHHSFKVTATPLAFPKILPTALFRDRLAQQVSQQELQQPPPPPLLLFRWWFLIFGDSPVLRSDRFWCFSWVFMASVGILMSFL